MKYFVIFSFIYSSLFAQRRGQIINEIKQFKIGISKNAVFYQPLTVVSDACYAAIFGDFENFTFEEPSKIEENNIHYSELVSTMNDISKVLTKFSRDLKQIKEGSKKDTIPKRYLKGITEKDSERYGIIIKIIGESPNIRISILYDYQIRTLVTHNGQSKYTDWVSFDSFINGQSEYKLKIYELLYGKIELSKEMIDRIEIYNAAQTKEKKKIFKEIDY